MGMSYAIFNRLFVCYAGMYVNDVQSGITSCNGSVSIIKEQAATAYIDGNNLLGPVVGHCAMDIAIGKAKETGVGWVVAKGLLF